MKIVNGNLKLRQLGIFGLSLFEDKSESETNLATTQQTDSTKETKSSITSTGTQAGTETTSLLSKEVQDTLEKLVLTLAGQFDDESGNAGTIESIGETLLARATGAADDINQNIAAIVSEERRIGEKAIESLTTGLAQSAGGFGEKSSSFVAGATAEGSAQLASQLARLQAELGIQSRGIESQELVSAIQAFAAGSGVKATDTNALTQIVAQLRGATAVTTTEQEQAQEQSQQVTELIDQLISGTQVGTTETTEKPSLISSLAKFF